MKFLKLSHWRSLWAPQNSISIYRPGALPLTALVCVALLIAGCAGSVTPSNSGGYSVTGTIAPAASGNGATVALSGPSSASTTANSSGGYTFSGLTNGMYAVTPTRAGYTFSPAVQSFTINGASDTGVNFTATASASSGVQLNWQASTSSVSGYNVYRGTTNGGPYSKLNGGLITALTYTDSSVTASTTYYYVTTAVNSAGEESGYSNQASAQVP
jgi:hypothetical protein